MIGYVLGALTALLHGATAWRYGYFRDELYFIACAKHLAWGYVDQPPLVAFAAWLSGPFGYGLVALRLLPVLSSGLAVYVAVLLARELGGTRFAQWLTGIAVGLMPAYLLLGNTLTTTSFESLSWTLAIYACVKLARRSGDPAGGSCLRCRSRSADTTAEVLDRAARGGASRRISDDARA